MAWLAVAAMLHRADGARAQGSAALRVRERQLGIAGRGLGSWMLNTEQPAQYGVAAALLYSASSRLTAEVATQ